MDYRNDSDRLGVHGVHGVDGDHGIHDDHAGHDHRQADLSNQGRSFVIALALNAGFVRRLPASPVSRPSSFLMPVAGKQAGNRGPGARKPAPCHPG